MGYLSIGYYTVCLSPFISLLVYTSASSLMGTSYGWLLPMIVFTGVHTLVIGIQVCGIILYLVGCKKEKVESKQVPFIVIFSILLILWGYFVSRFFFEFYEDEVIAWSMEPGVRELTIWDHLQFATWILKGLLWIASGLIFIVTSLIPKGSKSKLGELDKFLLDAK